MGQDESVMVDESVPPDVLESRDLQGLAKYINSGKCKRIVIMSGAGISTSAGIPDFRSPDTGLYANLARLNLPYAEAVFDIQYFRQNPLPFYMLAEELYPGKFRPTITHSFIRLLHDKGLLDTHFTQNIDCLDLRAGVPAEKVIEAHGSFARQSCIECKKPYPDDLMIQAVKKKTPPKCESCKGLVKPEIVFFGEALPSKFFENRHVPAMSDLVIVIGTSLTVQPFASLPTALPEGIPRVLLNLERVGGIGSRPDDILILGDCDEGVKKIAEACGWLEELESLWNNTGAGPGLEDEAAEADKKNLSKDEALEAEVEKLTKDVDKTLAISEEHIKTEKSAQGKERDWKDPDWKAPWEKGEHLKNLVEKHMTARDEGKPSVVIASEEEQANMASEKRPTDATAALAEQDKSGNTNESVEEPKKESEDERGLDHSYSTPKEKSNLS